MIVVTTLRSQSSVKFQPKSGVESGELSVEGMSQKDSGTFTASLDR